MKKGYRVKITLKHIRPPIWRRVWIPEDLNLHQFHNVIQRSMGWYNCHLHSFTVEGREYGMPDNDFPDDTIDDRGVPLKTVIKREGQKIRYLYDFGDSWEHEILFEKQENSEDGTPTVLKEKRA